MRQWKEIRDNPKTDEEKVIKHCVEAMHKNAHRDIESSGPEHIFNVACVKHHIAIEGEEKADGVDVGKDIDEHVDIDALEDKLGEHVVELLREAGLDTIEKVRMTSEDDLVEISGIGESTASKIVEAVGK